MRSGACLLIWLAPSSASIFQLDKAYPVLSSDNQPIAWSSGGPAALLASSCSFLRVNRRGIRTLSRPGRLRQLGPLGWSATACNLSAHAMCEAEVGRIFPMNAMRSPGDPKTLPKPWQDAGCTNTQGKTFAAVPAYDTSACDVLDEGVDIILAGNILYRSIDRIEDWAYWTLIVCAVVLVRGLSKNLRVRMEHQGDDDASWPSQDPSLVACLVCVVVVARDGGRMYATQHDFAFYALTVAYTVGYLAYHGALRIVRSTRAPPIYNMAAADGGRGCPGAFQLVALRLYSGAETPYNPVVIFVVATRAFRKLRNPTLTNTVTGFMDVVYLSYACDAGFTPSKRYLVPLMAGAFFASERIFG